MRPLYSAEQSHVQSQLRPDGWDEGVLLAFQRDPATRNHAVDLPGGGCLLLFTQDESVLPRLAAEVDALLLWLGTPPGFTVHLWWRDDPRHIDATQWPTKREVNGGWAIPGIPKIYVYRAEEYDRVLIHETIHAMEWDWEMPETPLPCWGLAQDAVVAPALFEAWTELYAEWLWCGWHDVAWEDQRAHQDEQAVQLLTRSLRSLHSVWREDTNLFAYYVLKAALAPHVAFLWVFGNGATPEERDRVLCGLVEPELRRLREVAARTAPRALSMRMTVLKK